MDRPPAVAYDSARQRTLLFGGHVTAVIPFRLAGTWEWDGSWWTQRRPQSSPPGGDGHEMAFDAARGRVVLFGGNALQDTWEFDGQDWIKRAPANRPQSRTGHALAYDSARRRVVLYGGRSSTGLSDTWEWDGTDWSRRFPTHDPGARRGHAMAYDAARGRTVLFGGSQTWEWDGTSWTRRFPLNSPRSNAEMVYDVARRRIVLFGGLGRADTWEWDGTDWTQRFPRSSPSGGINSAMAYDTARQRVVLLDAVRDAPETWEWDGSDWMLRFTTPGRRKHHALADDSGRGRVVLFGGTLTPRGELERDDTWEWDGTTWIQRSPAISPPARIYHAMTYDAARARVLLFGGVPGCACADTWEWDGSNWIERFPANSPSVRINPALAYDAARQRVVLFGSGFSPSSFATDTWEWDGSNWAQRFPAQSPNVFGYLAYDAGRSRTVLLGTSGGPAETWEWDGTHWVQRFPATTPTWGPIAYDVARGRVVMFSTETWEWDGTDWTQRFPSPNVPGRPYHPLVYDSARAQVLLFGGGMGGFGPPTVADTWVYGPTRPATAMSFGQGCAGSVGTPALSAAAGQRPWIGETFAFQLSGLPPSQPGAVFLGASNTSWGAVSLPFGLGISGMPGCTLYVSPDFTVPFGSTPGTLPLPVAVPTDPSLVGGVFYTQGKVIDPAANPLGVVSSNAVRATIGAK